jgi:CubicO group peptidase (beta-lactamase class C family)
MKPIPVFVLTTLTTLTTLATFFATAAPAAQRSSAPGPADVERSINPVRVGNRGDVVPLTLDKLMKLNRVPGFSVAVIHDYRIAWSKSYGAVAPGARARVTPRTLFLAGSVSKSVTAVAYFSSPPNTWRRSRTRITGR